MAIATGTQGGQKQERRSTDPPVASKGKFGQDLFLAIDHRNISEVKSLLSKGADANSRNGLEFTPLYIAAASHQPDVMQALLDAGAKPNEESSYGTALTFASATGHVKGAEMLMARGAEVNHVRADGTTPLIMAASSGNPLMIKSLLAKKAQVNAQNYFGATALAYAAKGGFTASAQFLLDAGAKVDLADTNGQTPLMLACKNGNVDMAKLLLKRGAKVNVRDTEGNTPMMLAAQYGRSMEMVELLKSSGANWKAKDAKGRTAGDLAAMHGFDEGARVLEAKPSAYKTRNQQTVIKSGLNLVQKSMTAFGKGTQCISCHQEGLGRMVTGLAKERGYTIDQILASGQRAKVNGALGAMQPLADRAIKDPEAMKQFPLIEINEVNPGMTWLLAGLNATHEPMNKANAAAAMLVAKQQMPNGSWTFSMPRVPMQSSVFTYTALAAQAIARYAPKENAQEVQERLGRAKNWLATTPAKSIDDLTFRLMGLKWTGATLAERKVAIDELLAQQKPDGGWSQSSNMRSDAYATGQAVYALITAGGIDASTKEIQNGVKFLVKTQGEDGSWFVNKRALPANNYFDGGFPHGESQYSSFNGTSWAVMALLEASKASR